MAVVLVRPTVRPAGPPGAELRGLPVAPRPLAPLGALAAAPTHFAWSAAAGAVSYRLEVLDAAGRTVYAAESGSTSLELPQGTLDTLRSARWRVVALDTEGHALATSEPVSFTLREH